MFPNMVEVVPEGRVGDAAVEHFEVDQAAARWSSVRDRAFAVREGRYARLTIKGHLWMSDTTMERRSNFGVVQAAHGRVLIAGLGLGMLLKPILENPKVTEVVVIEKFADVIALIAPHFDSPKLKVILGDIYEWRPAKGEVFNTIYFDIWPDVTTDSLADINKLHRAFARYKDKDDMRVWMDSWMSDHLRSKRRRDNEERRSGRGWGGW